MLKRYMHKLKLVVKGTLNVLAICIFVFLHLSKFNIAAYCALAAISVVSLSSAFLREKRLGNPGGYDNAARWLWGVFFAAPWVAFAVSIGYIGNEGLQESLSTQKYVIYGSLGLALIVDTTYMYMRRKDETGNKLRVATYTFAFVLYASIAASVYYLSILSSYNMPLYKTLSYPDETVRNTTCRTKTSSTDGTALIWAQTETSDVRCAYLTWEHLRSNILFLITFSISCSLLFDFERTRNNPLHSNLLARVLGLFSYFLQFAGYTNIIDSLDDLWTVNRTSLGLLCGHYAINIVVASLRFYNVNKAKNNDKEYNSDDDDTQQPPTDETPLMTPLEPVQRLDLSAVLRQRRFASTLNV